MDVFEALADPVRRELLRRVAPRPQRAGDLATGHGISRPAVSRHLRVLTEAGLVEGEVQGRERYFRLSTDGTAPVVAFLEELETTPAASPTLAGGPTADQWLALDTEVRRTGRERRRSAQSDSTDTDNTTDAVASTEESA